MAYRNSRWNRTHVGSRCSWNVSCFLIYLLATLSSDYSRFRWVDLQLDSLKKCLTYSDVKKALTSLPKTLSESYERILLAIDEEHRRKALVALQWISHCCQPITIEELAEAVIIDPSATQSFNPHDRIPKPSWLLEILSGLVVVTKTNRRLTGTIWTSSNLNIS